MTKERFLHIVSNPKDIAESDLGEIMKISDRHPYFDAAKILRLNGLKQNDDISFQDYLKEIAYTLPDRKHLYILLHRQAVREKVAEVVKDIHQQEANEAAIDEIAKSNELEVQELNDAVNKEENNVSSEQVETNAEEVKSISLPNDILENEIDQLTDSVLDDLLLKPLTAVYDIEKALGQSEKQSEKQKQEENENENKKEIENLSVSENESENESPFAEATGGSREEGAKEKFEGSEQQTSAKPLGERTFFDWLTPQTFEDEQAVENSASATPVKSSSEIIDSFIANNPRISSVSKSSPQTTFDKYSVEDRDEIVTETLARIYLKQNNYSRAIKVYEQLSLKNPEKRAYFASQIHFLEKLLKDK